MKPRPKTTNITFVIGGILTIGFLWFFLLPPTVTNTQIARSFQPARRNSGGIISRFDLRNITATGDALENRERILICTPIARWHDQYWENLMKLTYPRELIDLGYIIPKGEDGDQVIENLRVRLREVQGKNGVPGGKFNHVTILRQDVEVPMSQDEKGIYIMWSKINIRTTCIRTSKNPEIHTICCKEFSCLDHLGTSYRVGIMVGFGYRGDTSNYYRRYDGA